MIDDVEGADIPSLLARLNFIFATPRDPFDNAIDTLCSALSTDIEWIREHTRLGGLARRWDDAGRPARLLRRGRTLRMWNAGATGVRQDTRHHTAARRLYRRSAPRGGQAAQELDRRRRGHNRSHCCVGGLCLSPKHRSGPLARHGGGERRRCRGPTRHRRTQRAEAVEGRNAALLNESRFLAGMSAQMWEEGRAAEAVALAVEALPDEADPDRPLSQEALRSLRNARLDLRETARAAGQDMISGAVFSPDGQWIATSDTEAASSCETAPRGKFRSDLMDIARASPTSSGAQIASFC